MNYEKHYKLLCSSRQQLNRNKLAKADADYSYYELHHIVPRYEGGTNEIDNLVLLTAREHFIAHILYAKWKRTSKAWACVAAFKLFTNFELSSKQIELIRQARSTATSLQMLGNSYSKGIKWTKEQRDRQSARQKGRVSNRKGVVLTEEQKAKISTALMGNEYCKGHKQSRETVLKRQIARKDVKPQTKEKLIAELLLFQEQANKLEQ